MRIVVSDEGVRCDPFATKPDTDALDAALAALRRAVTRGDAIQAAHLAGASLALLRSGYRPREPALRQAD